MRRWSVYSRPEPLHVMLTCTHRSHVHIAFVCAYAAVVVSSMFCIAHDFTAHKVTVSPLTPDSHLPNTHTTHTTHTHTN